MRYLQHVDQVVRFEEKPPITYLASFIVGLQRYAIEVRSKADAVQIEQLAKAAAAAAAAAAPAAPTLTTTAPPRPHAAKSHTMGAHLSPVAWPQEAHPPHGSPLHPITRRHGGG